MLSKFYFTKYSTSKQWDGTWVVILIRAFGCVEVDCKLVTNTTFKYMALLWDGKYGCITHIYCSIIVTLQSLIL